MDRRVKERLIGASILVVLVVLIVPELLSGPKRPATPSMPQLPVASGAAEAVRNVTVDLATSKTTAEDPAAAASAAGTPAAGPPAGGTPGPETITTLKAQQSAPSSSSEPVVRAPTPGVEAAAAVAAAAAGATSARSAAAVSAPAEPARHGWSVQLGSFASKGNAEVLIRRLRAEKAPVYMSPTGSGRSQRFRVRVGPLGDRAAAERTMARLKKEGHAGTLVPP